MNVNLGATADPTSSMLRVQEKCLREGHRRLEETRHVLDQRRDAAALPAQTDAEARSILSVELNAETDSEGLLNAACPRE